MFYKKKIILLSLILFILCVITLVFTFYPSTASDFSLGFMTLHIEINQTPDYKLSLNNISLIAGYPSDYKLNLREKFYLIKMLDSNAQVLFTGEVSHTNTFTPIDTLGSSEVKNVIAEPEESIMLNLPYLDKATKLILEDEFGEAKFELPLYFQNLSMPTISKDRCGNNMCDINESVINCFSDCRYQLDEFKEVITTKLLP